jgi:hypothetical protein
MTSTQNNATLLEELANAELQYSINKIINPKKTKKTWDSKKQEFQKWCLNKGYLDRETVTGSKLIFFNLRRL